ncbi:MAG: hypothetical protein Q9208_001234 [Pyrenodesmia sp. 3 TL-2023]
MEEDGKLMTSSHIELPSKGLTTQPVSTDGYEHGIMRKEKPVTGTIMSDEGGQNKSHHPSEGQLQNILRQEQ